MARKKKGKGALAQSPNINPKTGKPFKFTIKELQARQAAGETLGKRGINRLKKAGLYEEPSSEPAPIQELPPEQMFERVGGQTAAGIESLMGQIQGAGAFQPGNYQDMMNQAYQNVMNQFEMTQGPQFAREQANFQQMAAERGLDPNSEAYKTLQSQLNQRQDFARQNAMQVAQQQAQAVQQQGFNQALQQYQAPGQMLGAYSPFYAQFGQQQANLQQAEIQREQMANQLAMQRMSSGATLGAAQAANFGKLTPEQTFELQRIKEEGATKRLEAQLGAQAPQQSQMSTGNYAAQGFAQGFGQGLSKGFFG